MSVYEERGTERDALLGTVDPVSQGAGTISTDVVDMRYFQRVRFLILVGVLGAAATVDFAVKGDTVSGGAFATTITGKTITQLTKVGTDDNKQVWVEVTAEEAAQQGFRYLRGDLTVAVAASLVCVAVLGGPSRYSPGSEFDLASVDEIVA